MLLDLLPALPSTFWPDVVKTLIGSFAGAALAFASNTWFQSRDRRRRDKAAGNLALSVLARQYSDYLVVRRGFQEEKTRVVQQVPNAPKWLYARPMHFYFSQSLKFDYNSLTFLFNREAGGLFSTLALVEQRYHDLASLLGTFNEAAERLQEKLVAAGIRNGQDFLVGEAEEAIGHDLTGKVVSLIDALNLRFQQDEIDYEAACEELRNAVTSSFGDKGVVKLETKPT